MGVSEVLLCPYRCLEYKIERLEKLKIQLCFYSLLLTRSEVLVFSRLDYGNAVGLLVSLPRRGLPSRPPTVNATARLIYL